MIRYRSTRGDYECSFLEAVVRGIAPDGGLFVPTQWPTLNLEVSRMASLVGNMNQQDGLVFVAKEILWPFMKENLTRPEFEKLIEMSLNFEIPLKHLKPNVDRENSGLSVLELFHGPTAAFKDVAAQFLARFMEMKIDEPLRILVATSGDTGGAIASAFEKSNFKVCIFFPKKGVSHLQFRQLTCWSGKIFAFAVDGDFDDCQNLVKGFLTDESLRQKYHLSSANSINIIRLLPQMVYHAYASLIYAHQKNVAPTMVVPTGNLGNAVAAFWARRLGFPISRIVLATNSNRALKAYYKTGVFEVLPTLRTLANAMDVGNPSNFERLRHLHPKVQDLKVFSEVYLAEDDRIRQAIRDGVSNWNEIWCPHTAVAISAIEDLKIENPIAVATAHPAKFAEIVEPLIGKKVSKPPALLRIEGRESKFREVSKNPSEILEIFKVIL